MSAQKAASWLYSEELITETPIIEAARVVADEIGVNCSSPATGQFLATLASLPNIKTVAEIGTGTGVSALHILLASEQITLTSLDTDAEAQNYARQLFQRAEIRTARYRLINGQSADLLPRLANSAYDLVIVDGDPLEAQGDAEEAIRMLRPGGILVLLHALYQDRVADPARRDDITVAWRDLGVFIMQNPDLTASLSPLGDGILIAVKK